jgi:acyl-ACP thioesterase
MEKVATSHFICEPFHSDFSGHLTLSVLGNHLLNCAGQHASARGFGMARLNQEEHTWVLSRMAIEFDELPRQYEKFEIDTWVENVYRLFTDRNFAFRDSEGRTIGYARTVWAMIGLTSRKPLDVEHLYGGLIPSYVYPERECPIEKPGRIKVTAKEPSDSFVAHYSDIDINGHVNSVRYIEHVMDLFTIDFLRQHRLYRFDHGQGDSEGAGQQRQDHLRQHRPDPCDQGYPRDHPKYEDLENCMQRQYL